MEYLNKILAFLIFFLYGEFTFAQPKLLSQKELSAKKIYTSLSEALMEPEEVYILCLSYYELKTVPKEILRLKNLQLLSLDGNYIEYLPDGFERLKYLQHIDLSDNPLLQTKQVIKKLALLRNRT